MGDRAVRLAALVIAAAIAAVPLAAQDVGLPIGATPAAAQVQDTAGNAVDLSRFVGTKPVLLEFWATWCPLCAALMPKMQAAHNTYGDRVEFVIVGVGVNQTLASIRRHLARDPLPGQVYFDATGAAVRAYAAPSTSYVVVLDAHGHVVYTGSGEDQDIEAAVRRAVGR